MSEEETSKEQQEVEETATTTEIVDEVIIPEVKTSNDDVESEPTIEPEPVKPVKTKEQKKIAELSYKTREKDRQIERLLKAVETQSQAITQKQEPKAPKIEDFETVDEYVDAKLEYHDSKKSQPEVELKSEPDDDLSFRKNELFENGTAKYEDFEDIVAADNVKITTYMRDAIFEIEDPDIQVEVAYFLGNNTKEVRRISKLSPLRQIAEITRLEDKLFNPVKPQKRASLAPEPIKPVGGSKTTSDAFVEGESYESFLKKRSKQIGR